jgi:Ca-activated chloride channel homolog
MVAMPSSSDMRAFSRSGAVFGMVLATSAVLGSEVGGAFCPRPALRGTESASAAGDAASEAMVKLWALAEGPRRKLVLDLRASDFQVFDEGRPQKLAYFAAPSRESLALGLLIETSRSRLYEPEPADWQPYSALLHKVLRRGDKAFVATFAEKAELHGDFTDNLQTLDSALQQVFTSKPEGITGLYDSIFTLCEERFRGEPGRRVLLVVSDTPDESSAHNQLQTLERIERSGITVYTVLPWVDRLGQPPFGDVRFAQYFADQTGGLFFLAHSRKMLEGQLDGIRMALDYTYTLGFIPPPSAHDGRYHGLRVRCDRPGVKLHVGQGYYASKGGAE